MWTCVKWLVHSFSTCAMCTCVEWLVHSFSTCTHCTCAEWLVHSFSTCTHCTCAEWLVHWFSTCTHCTCAEWLVHSFSTCTHCTCAEWLASYWLDTSTQSFPRTICSKFSDFKLNSGVTQAWVNTSTNATNKWTYNNHTWDGTSVTNYVDSSRILIADLSVSTTVTSSSVHPRPKLIDAGLIVTYPLRDGTHS